MNSDLPHVDPSALHFHARPQWAEPTSHFVELYEDDRALVESLTRFISIGFARGDAAIVIADHVHRESLERDLDRVFDLDAARKQGHYVSRDAAQTLAMFMDHGVPDPLRFERVVQDVLAEVKGPGKKLRIFGEMVSILWSQGNVSGALLLEDLWNELAEREPFRLFCAYPAPVIGQDQALLTAVCDRHSHVLVTAPGAP